MSFTIREDFLEPNEPSPKIIDANIYDKMMARENYLNFTSATNSEQETVSNWNRHRWEQEGKEPLGSLHTQFDHWKVDGLQGRIIQDDFFAVAGRGKLCKGAGLTGAEKKACKKNIKAKCKGKPLFGKAKKQAWEECASKEVVTPEQAAKEAAEKLVPTSEDKGLSMGAKIMLGVAIAGTLTLIGFAVLRGRKSGVAQPAMKGAR